MTVRTVLLYFATESDVERLTPLAARLLTPVDGASPGLLVGSHASPLMAFHGGVVDALADGLAMRQADAVHAEAVRLRERFVALAGELGAEATWDSLVDDERGERTALRERARASDLVVLPQPAEEGGSRFVELAVRELVGDTGRPVLIVPRVGKYPDVGHRPLVGWCPTREATRAVHDALAVLRPDCRATLLWVSRGRTEPAGTERSARAMAGFLERHGVRCEVTRWTHAEIPIGDVLLNESFERGADLLVVGGFGHSRLHDAVVGATTTHLLEHMTLPVLFSH